MTSCYTKRLINRSYLTTLIIHDLILNIAVSISLLSYSIKAFPANKSDVMSTRMLLAIVFGKYLT